MFAAEAAAIAECAKAKQLLARCDLLSVQFTSLRETISRAAFRGEYSIRYPVHKNRYDDFVEWCNTFNYKYMQLHPYDHETTVAIMLVSWN